MPFEQPPSPVAPATPGPARPWTVPLSGGAGVLLLLLIGAFDSYHAERAMAAALAAAGFTLLLSLQAFRFARARDSEPAPAPKISKAAPEPERQLRVHETLEALPDPVLVISAIEPDDLAGRRVVFANRAAREVLRIQREGVLLVTLMRNPEVLEAVDEALFGDLERTAAFETGGSQSRFWRAWTRPLPASSDGERLAVLCLRDETDSRRMEQMRADFLANASHELRTPLASLAGFIETLKGHAKDDPVARDRFLNIMSAQADRMSRLIADLLSLSRIELNEHIPPSGSVDLSLVVMDVVDALAPQALDRKVSIAPTLLPARVARVCGDRDQIIQVVQNLVDNAIKYSPAESAVEVEMVFDLTADQAAAHRMPDAAKLSLLTPDHADAARYVLVRVRDHGPGIARQHLPRLTERFYRVEGQKSGERLGTGLGLAIVKHIVNRHRGGLLVESVPGEGATFSVYLPLALAPAMPAEPAPAPAMQGLERAG